MITWLKNRRAHAEARRAAEAQRKAEEEAKLQKELDDKATAIKAELTRAGIYTLGWGMTSRRDEFARVYGILNGRLIECTISRKGGLVIYYVGEEK